MKETTGQVLRRLRRTQGLSLRQVAAHLGVHLTTVSSWERGRSQPAFATLERLADLLGVAAGDLLGRERFPAPDLNFRPLSVVAAESVARELEEIRLLAALARELEARPQSAAELSLRTGVEAPRLTALAGGTALPRPAEIAALVRELGSAAPVDLPAPGPTPPSGLPPGAATRLELLLQRLRRYLAGEDAGSHQ